jgi:DHA1 family tetracycline resistance protein-like MFS transporter
MDKKRITITFLIVLTNAVGATAILPMLPIFAEKQFRATPVQAMFVIAAYYAAQFVAAPWLGKLSDRFGRRSILIISQIGTVLSYLLFIFASPLGDQVGIAFGLSGGLLVIYLARLLDGLTGGNVSVAEAYASDISDEKSRAQSLGLIGGASGLGHILGPALAVALSGISLIAPMVGALVASGVTLLLTIILLDESRRPQLQSARQSVVSNISVVRLLGNRSVVIVLVTAFITSLYMATVFSSFSLFAERVLFPDQPAKIVVRNVNLMIMIIGVTVTINQIFLIAPLVKRWGEQALVLIGSALLLASAIGISSGSFGLVLVSILIYSFGYAMSWPSLQAIMTYLSSQQTIGRQLGLVQSAFSFAFILAPLIAGYLLQNISPQAIFLHGALLMGLATFLSILIFHVSLPRSEDQKFQGETGSVPESILHRFHH